MNRISSLTGAALLLAAVAAQAAGTVEVKTVKPEEFTDIGFSTITRDRNIEVISDYLKKLGARLPDGQVLRVELLDVDLAGRENTMSINNTRVLRGRADWPAIKLRYTLADGSSTVASGEERLTDMAYLNESLPLRYSGTELGYEKRMLQRWFDDKIAPAKIAASPK